MEHYHFIVDAWRMFKKYRAVATNTEEYFDTVLDAAKALTDRYPHIGSFALDIMVAICGELERIAKGGG